MKKINNKLKGILISATILLSSCVTQYYQVYKTHSPEGVLKNNKMIFEDKNCKVSYDLWTEGGLFDFYIYNKSESDITLNLTKTFFVLNGISYEYFQNRTFSKSTSNGASMTTSYSPYNLTFTTTKIPAISSYSTTFIEKPELTIPSKTSIKVSQFKIADDVFTACDLEEKPRGSENSKMIFSEASSPYVFSNIITYNCKGETQRLQNSFFVNEIANVPASEMLIKIDTTECGDKISSDLRIKSLKRLGPDEFYIPYKIK